MAQFEKIMSNLSRNNSSDKMKMVNRLICICQQRMWRDVSVRKKSDVPGYTTTIITDFLFRSTFLSPPFLWISWRVITYSAVWIWVDFMRDRVARQRDRALIRLIVNIYKRWGRSRKLRLLLDNNCLIAILDV